ncbi:MAG: hypothetical protein J6X44_12140, partial [Thermoguttaceae bacterium]|nr:hypothetical protein [Thermoguttaceae bacterium]
MRFPGRFLLYFTAVFASFCANNVFADFPFFLPASSIEQPTEWKSNEDGNKAAGDCLLLSSSEPSSGILSQKIAFESRKLYRYSFKLSQLGGSGRICACCGSEFFNYDYVDVPEDKSPTTEYSEVIFVPDGDNGKYESAARFAKWESGRAYKSTLPEIKPVQPLFKLIKNNKNCVLPLGDGETLGQDGNYQFISLNSHERTNYDRTLVSSTSNFNTDRWTFSNGTTLVYRLALEPFDISNGTPKSSEPIQFVSGSVDVRVGYWIKGTLVVEGSFDGNSWTKLGEISKIDNASLSLAALLQEKRSSIWIRLKGADSSDDSQGCSLQVHGFSATLQTEQENDLRFVGAGETIFADFDSDGLENAATINGQLWGIDEDDNLWAVENGSNRLHTLSWDSEYVKLLETSNVEQTGSSQKTLKYIANLDPPVTVVRSVFPFFEQNYASVISGGVLKDTLKSGADLSWCDSDYRVPLAPKIRKILPESKISISSAKNDVESFQIVVHA